MIIHDCKCNKCGKTYDVDEMGMMYLCNGKEFKSLEEVECPQCKSTEKEVRYFEE